MTLYIAIPAAGSSSRMRGRDKLLEHVDGHALLRRQVMAAAATGQVLGVFLRNGDFHRREALAGLEVPVHDVPDAEHGLSGSLRMAARVCGPDRDLMVLLPDVPGIGTTEIQTAIDLFNDHGCNRVVRATDPKGRPGTPIIMPRRIIPTFEALQGDTGAREILRDEAIVPLVFPDDRATLDLDTPEDWADFRARNTLEK